MPLVQDGTFPSGYWNGACTLTVQADSGQTTPFAFTVAPLAYSGNAVAAFQTLVTNIQQDAHAQLASQAGTDAWGQVASELTPLIDQWAAQLTQMATNAGMSGTATLAMDLPVTSAPNPPVITVSGNDITNLVAFLNVAAPTLLTAQTSSQAQARVRSLRAYYNDDGSATCLIRNQQTFTVPTGQQTTFGHVYSACVENTEDSVQTQIAKLAGSVLFRLPLLGCQYPSLTDTPAMLGLIMALQRIANSNAILCNVVPIVFSGFEARQTPPQSTIPLGTLENTNNLGTHVYVNLSKNYDPATDPSIQSTLGKMLAGLFVQDLQSLASSLGCGALDSGTIQLLYKPLAAAETLAAGNLIQSFSSAFPLVVQAEVYKCDLADVEPADPFALNHRTDKEGTLPPYYFEGKEVGPTRLAIGAIPSNFILANDSGFAAPPPVAVDAPPAEVQDFLNRSYATVTVSNSPTLAVQEELAFVVNGAEPETEPAPGFCSPPYVIAGAYSVMPGQAPPIQCDNNNGVPTAYLPYGTAGTVTGVNNYGATAYVTATQNDTGYKYTVVIAASVASDPFSAGDGPFGGDVKISLLATNPAPAGGQTQVKIHGELNLSPPGFPDGIVMITDSKGNSAITNSQGNSMSSLSLYPGDNPSNFDYTADSTDSAINPVAIYVGMYANGAPPHSVSNTFSVTLTIEFLNVVRPAESFESPLPGLRH